MGQESLREKDSVPLFHPRSLSPQFGPFDFDVLRGSVLGQSDYVPLHGDLRRSLHFPDLVVPFGDHSRERSRDSQRGALVGVGHFDADSADRCGNDAQRQSVPRFRLLRPLRIPLFHPRLQRR